MNFFEKRRWAKLLKGCRYDFVAEKLETALNGSFIPKELASLLDAYCSRPCLETAVELIKYDLHNQKENVEDTTFLNLFLSGSNAGREEFYKFFKKAIFSPEEKESKDLISQGEFES
ncbi:MAG: hypothetical protein LLF92_01425 [Planctomycetaceae bacterium]|nr:hypothetical protein [Planctomycetaceae bacterium]